MNDIELSVFLDSFERCNRDPSFLDFFYASFLSSSEEVAEKFRRTNFRRQKMALRASIFDLVTALGRKEADLSQLARVAESHNRAHLDIRPELYDLFLTNLLGAVARSDPRWDARIEGIWRAVLSAGIEYMRARY